MITIELKEHKDLNIIIKKTNNKKDPLGECFKNLNLIIIYLDEEARKEVRRDSFPELNIQSHIEEIKLTLKHEIAHFLMDQGHATSILNRAIGVKLNSLDITEVLAEALSNYSQDIIDIFNKCWNIIEKDVEDFWNE